MFHFRVQLDVFRPLGSSIFTKISQGPSSSVRNARTCVPPHDWVPWRRYDRTGNPRIRGYHLSIRNWSSPSNRLRSNCRENIGHRNLIELKEQKVSNKRRVWSLRSSVYDFVFNLFSFIFISMFLNFMLYLNLHVCVVIVYILRKQELSYLTTRAKRDRQIELGIVCCLSLMRQNFGSGAFIPSQR